MFGFFKKDRGQQKSGGQAPKPAPAAAPKADPKPAPEPAKPAPEGTGIDIEKLRYICGKLAEIVLKQINESDNELGPQSCCCIIPGTENDMYLQTRYIRGRDTQVSVGVVRVGTDAMKMSILFHGEIGEVKEYLASPELPDRMLKVTLQLSESVDKCWQG